ncbi:hypothetical protein Fmac_006601 [Flemingia macrophylla]|uniref:Uncharacterized protein n=1 Tax=Flemingia macrophylla TaxID=520843 RepID=A0ABD1NBL6_9FABA
MQPHHFISSSNVPPLDEKLRRNHFPSQDFPQLLSELHVQRHVPLMVHYLKALQQETDRVAILKGFPYPSQACCVEND